MSLPAESNGGRTYTFTIGQGFAFSPPSNEPITAQTYAYSIERALSPVFGDQAQGSGFIEDIEGEAAYRSGDAEHITGIRAEGDTLSITLIAPSDTFLDRLAVPSFCPVPLDTPIVTRRGERPHRGRLVPTQPCLLGSVLHQLPPQWGAHDPAAQPELHGPARRHARRDRDPRGDRRIRGDRSRRGRDLGPQSSSTTRA